MDLEEAKEAVSRFESDPVLADLDAAIEAEKAKGASTTESAAAIGGRYPLGLDSVGAARPGALVALALIASPLIGRPEDMTDADAFRALYAVEGGPEVMDPILGLDMRLRQARAHEEDAKKDPGLYEVYLRHLDGIQADAWREFDREARAFCERFGPITAGEAIEVVAAVLKDGRAAATMIRSTGGTVKKKSEISESTNTTPIGSPISRLSRLPILGSILAKLRGATVSPN